MKLFYFIIFLILLALFMAVISIFYPRSVYLANSLLYHDLPMDTVHIPKKNKLIINYVEQNGHRIAPSYKDVVCTEYVIYILNKFCSLDAETRKKIRIITDRDIETLLAQNSDLVKGVYYALISNGQGMPVKDPKLAKAGDFIQFWDEWNGKTFGHCGIVRAVDEKKGLISLYSSSPKTNGHGSQIYVWPKHMFIVRLK